jgi:hypothetical protein
VATPFDRDYIDVSWDFESASSRSTLGFVGFIFQSLVAAVIILAAYFKQGRGLGGSSASFLLGIILPLQVLFWAMWFRESRRLRRIRTHLLNLSADAEHFKIPRLSAVNAQFAAEAALLLVVEGLAMLYFALFVS